MIALEILLHGFTSKPVEGEEPAYSLSDFYSSLVTMLATKQAVPAPDTLIGSGLYINAVQHFSDEDQALFDSLIADIAQLFVDGKVDTEKRYRVTYHTPCYHGIDNRRCADFVVLHEGGQG